MRPIDADAIEWKGFEKDIGKFVFKRKVDEMPTVDPVKHGRWDINYGNPMYDHCTICHK